MSNNNQVSGLNSAQIDEFANAVVDIIGLVKLRHVAKQLVFFPRKIAHSQLAGGQRSLFRGRGMDFEEVRHYQPSDDVRNIDWRVTARTRTPHTKIFREERERPIFIVTDMRRPMLFGSRKLKAETASRVSTALAWAGLNANDRVGALLFGPRSHIEIKPRRSHHNVLKLIHALHDLCAELLNSDRDSFTANKMIEEIRRVAHPGSSIFIVSDFQDMHLSVPNTSKTTDNGYEENLYELSRHCDVTLCQVYDPLEKQLPPPGFYAVLNDGKASLLDTGSRDLQALCSQQFQRRNTALKHLCSKLGLGLLSFNTDQDEMTQLISAYGKRRRKKK